MVLNHLTRKIPPNVLALPGNKVTGSRSSSASAWRGLSAEAVLQWDAILPSLCLAQRGLHSFT